MPIYDFQCSECGHQDEVIRKASDANTATCPACEKDTFSKMLSAPSFKLNGSGWYETDFKDKPKAKGASKETSKAESAQKTDKAPVAD